ncbi:MAG: GNAT family N-acetyltransferase [Verrucomicrobiota bacterium]
MIEFREVTLKNLSELVALEVSEAQKGLVADNLYTVAQVSLVPESYCRGVYLDQMPVAFFAVETEKDHRYIWRFMVAKEHQGKGIGSQMMAKLLAELFSDPSVEFVDLSVQRKPGGAEPFYRKCGFTATEKESDGEWQMLMTRSDYEKG